jgi:hypothetical protein
MRCFNALALSIIPSILAKLDAAGVQVVISAIF